LIDITGSSDRGEEEEISFSSKPSWRPCTVQEHVRMQCGVHDVHFEKEKEKIEYNGCGLLMNL